MFLQLFKKRQKAVNRHLPLRHVAIMTISIFVVEVCVMMLMHRYLFVSDRVDEFVDASLLVILLSPVLYFFLFRPMMNQIDTRRRAESVLQLERDKLKGILDAMADGVCIVNRDYTVAYTNPVVARAFGPVRDRMCFEFLYSRREVCPGCNISAVARDGRTWMMEVGSRTYSVFEAPLANADGSISKLEILHDITVQKKNELALRESEKHLQNLSSQLLTAQETEKRRISRELHDQMGQDLALLKIRLRAIEKEMPADCLPAKETIGRLLGHIDAMIENIRRISHDLSPALLDDIGLSAALKSMAEDFAREYRITMSFAGIDIDRLFPDEKRVIVFRLLQEALTNIVKHAHATEIDIGARREQGAILFTVEDNGTGFIPGVEEKPLARKGMGIAAMRQRVQMLGGSLEIRSGQGKGTALDFRIPLESDG